MDRVCFAMAAAMTLSASAGCYKTIDLPRSELTKLSFKDPASAQLTTDEGTPVELTSSTTLVLTRTYGGKKCPVGDYVLSTCAEYREINVAGGRFDAVTTDGRKVRIELAEICEVKVEKLSIGRSIGYPLAIVRIAFVVILIVGIAATGGTGYGGYR